MSLFQQLESSERGASRPLAEVLDAMPWGSDGLLPAVAQDHDSREVLMLAWMSRESLARTLDDGYATYYSRSRRALWRKGESSGHLQQVVEVRLDCDGDALLLCVRQSGPACHTNRPSCFYLAVDGDRVRIVSDPDRPGQ